MTLARLLRRSDDGGSAIVEFVFVAVIVMVPLIYVIAAVATVQRNNLAVTQAARAAGRAYATSESSAQARMRAAAAVRLALADQGLPDDATVRYVRAGADCGDPQITPRLSPGTSFRICVVRRFGLPAVPDLLIGKGIRVNGEYDVHVDDYREVPR